jgi:hypothetical protein
MHDIQVSKIDNIGQRTEEIDEIIERMPSRFGYYVSGIVIILVIALFTFGWFIRYPDKLKGQITVTTRQAPVKLVSNATGVLQLIKSKPGGMVAAGEYIAYIKNAADVNDVRRVDSFLKNFKIGEASFDLRRNYFPESVSLGELSNKYFIFLNALYQYLDYYRGKPYSKQKDMLVNYSTSQRKSLQETQNEYERLKDKYELSLSLFRKDSVLFSEGLIPKSEFEQSRMGLISNEQEFKIRNKEIISNQYQISDATSKLQLLNLEKTDKERDLGVALTNFFYDLTESIKKWEHSYVFKSPVNGRVEFLNFLRDEDYILQGQDMFSILLQQNELVGQVLLPSFGAGKIKPGQKVIIKLDDYPYTQYGSIRGKVLSVSQVTNAQVMSNASNKINTYLINIDLPNGLLTSYNTSLNFHYEAKGIAEIITDDRRLIERFFSNLKHKVSE